MERKKTEVLVTKSMLDEQKRLSSCSEAGHLPRWSSKSWPLALHVLP